MKAVCSVIATAFLTLSGLTLGAAMPASAERLRICFEDWPPFATVVEGRVSGLVIDITDRALAAAGHSAVYSLQPYQRCIGNVRSGEQDAMLMTSDETGLVATSRSVAFWEVGVIARPDWPRDDYSSLAEFAGATVGLVKAYTYHPAVTAALADWRVHYTADALFNLRMTANGRIDFTIADIPWARVQAARERLGLKVLSPILFAAPQYTYFHPGHSKIVTELDAALQSLLDDGTVDRLYSDALGADFQAVRARAAAGLIRD